MPDHRVAVVGCGGIGRRHLEAYRANGVEPIAVADVDEQSAARAAREFGGRPYSDYRDLLAHERCDAVSVCTPPSLHVEQCTAFLSSGAIVLCEKPLAATVEACEQILQEGKRLQRMLAVGFCHRYHPPVERLKTLVAEGRLGRLMMFHNRFPGNVRHIAESWRAIPAESGGGVLLDNASHSVDLFRYLVGEVAEVRALTSTTASDLGPTLDVDDTAVMALRSRDGVLGAIETSWRIPAGSSSLTLFGTAASATVDYSRGELTVRGANGSEHTEEVPAGDRFDLEIADFLTCLGPVPSTRIATAADGAEATRVVLAAYRSAAGVG